MSGQGREPPTPVDPSFRIELPAFEGPLDLLLHLIQKHELDILDLPIAFVTEKYLGYIGLMKQLDLDVASEYLVMAAELARIKSKMLLPPSPDDEEEVGEDEIDPRADLIRRLLEYQKYKKAGEDLGSRDLAGRDVFSREVPSPEAQGPAPLKEMGIFELLDAFSRVLSRARADLSFEVTAERITIQDRIASITDILTEKKSCRFEALFEGATSTYDIVVTFLAILEMAKMGITRIYQAEAGAPIHLTLRLLSAEPGPDEEAEGETVPGAAAAAAAPANDAPEAAPAGEQESGDATSETAGPGTPEPSTPGSTTEALGKGSYER